MVMAGTPTRRPGSLHDDERNGNGHDDDTLTGQLMRAVAEARDAVERAEAVARSTAAEHETYTRTVHAIHRRVDELAGLHAKADAVLASNAELSKKLETLIAAHGEQRETQERTARIVTHTRALVPVLIAFGELVRYALAAAGVLPGGH